MPDKSFLHLLVTLTLCFGFGATSCSGNNPDPTPGKTLYFDVNIPTQTEKKFSAYVFKNGILKGAVLSNSATDKSGKLKAVVKKVDANNCLTGEDFIPEGGLYNFHYRLDTAGNSSIVYPTVCGNDKGFLQSALSGGSFTLAISGPTSFPVTQTPALAFVQFSLNIAGFNAVSRISYCSLLDGDTASPGIANTATLGISQAYLNFTAGAGNFSLSGLNAVAEPGAPMRYACWVDADGSASYNTGDYIASGFLNTTSVSVGSWTTVP